MESAKAAINKITSKAGHKDTTVHETVAPGVTHEQVKPHEHEEVNPVLEQEVHQDHYHRTVQPVEDREVLPEKHTANVQATQNREYDHRDTEKTKAELVAEQGQFKSDRRVEGTTHSQSTAPTVAGEHVHHHVHETIQPVVHKETIQPNVVHTTVPVHETHHNAAKHHHTSELPPVTMSEFKERGGVMSGREERFDAFEGEPKNIGGALGGSLGNLKGGNRTDATGKKRDSMLQNDEELRRKAQHGELDPVDGRGAHENRGISHENRGVGHESRGLSNENRGVGHENRGLSH